MSLLTRGWPSSSSHVGVRVRRLAPWVLLAVVAGWVHLAQFSATLEWDSHIFMVIGQQIRLGLLPYRDLWELKPPGTFYYLATVFTVLPETLWSVRIADFFFYLVAGVCFYRICRTELDPPLAFFGAAVWLYFSHHPFFDVGGVYTEGYAALAAIMAVAAAVRYAQTGALKMALLSGVGVACAALFKHPGIAALAPTVIIMSRRPRFSAALMYWVGCFVPIGLTVGYFWAQGALDDFMACNVWALGTHGGLNRGVDEALLQQRVLRLWDETVRLFAPFPILFGALAVGIPVCLMHPSFMRWAALSWAIIDFVGVAAQRNYYQHHYILTFPSLCLVGILGVGFLIQPRPKEHRIFLIPRIAFTAVVFAWLFPFARAAVEVRAETVREQWAVLLSGPEAWQKSPGRRFEEEVGGYIRQRTQPSERIHLQGWGATALAIYWEAQRRVSTRFFYEAPFPIDTTRELAELQANRPEYVVVASEPPFLFMSDWLASDYSLESVKWLDYPAKIFVRTKERTFADGGIAQLTPIPGINALSIADTRSVGGVLPEARRGWWTSPALKIQSDDGTVALDWNPRVDLAYNVNGRGLATIEALSSDPANEARVLLGETTQRGRWSAWWRQETIPITVRFGFPAMIDHVTLVAVSATEEQSGCTAPEIASSLTAADPGSFTVLQGTWHMDGPGIRTFRFPPRRADGIRVLGSPASCDFSSGLGRIRVHAAGMGIHVRYRTGDQPDLSAVAWQDVPDAATQIKVPGAQFVQLQYELWSMYGDVAPVLHHAQIGRVRFNLPPATMTAAVH